MALWLSRAQAPYSMNTTSDYVFCNSVCSQCHCFTCFLSLVVRIRQVAGNHHLLSSRKRRMSRLNVVSYIGVIYDEACYSLLYVQLHLPASKSANLYS